jgi:hypothetical protein
MNDGAGPRPKPTSTRLERRDSVVQVVEYSRYPRRRVGETRRIAYTQDRSESGFGLDLPEALDPGELLQLIVRDIDGEVALDGLARVIWCEPTRTGRARAGVSMLRERGEQPMMRVRTTTSSSASRGRRAQSFGPR